MPIPGSGDDGGLSRDRSRSERAREFDSSYAGTPPWDIGRPQTAFSRVAESGSLRGRVLDVGCGTGEHAIMAAQHGHEATGVDAAPRAIELARRKAEQRRADARFLVWDALDLGSLSEKFDTVLDSGLFHVFDDYERAQYVESLRAAVSTGGCYYVLCFSERQPGDWGPRRVTRDEIRKSFGEGWEVVSIEPAVLDTTISTEAVLGWFATIVRG